MTPSKCFGVLTLFILALLPAFVSASQCTEYLCQELAVSRTAFTYVELLDLLNSKQALILESPRLTRALNVIQNNVSLDQCLGMLEIFEIASDSVPYVLPCADIASHESGVWTAAVWVCAALLFLLLISSMVYIYKLKEDFANALNQADQQKKR